MAAERRREESLQTAAAKYSVHLCTALELDIASPANELFSLRGGDADESADATGVGTRE